VSVEYLIQDTPCLFAHIAERQRRHAVRAAVRHRPPLVPPPIVLLLFVVRRLYSTHFGKGYSGIYRQYQYSLYIDWSYAPVCLLTPGAACGGDTRRRAPRQYVGVVA
jgi:hypothetical protein